jgi:hypothetical protein
MGTMNGCQEGTPFFSKTDECPLLGTNAMRKLSRNMPSAPTRPLTPIGVGCLLAIAAGLVTLVYAFPGVLFLFGALAVLTVVLTIVERRRLAELAATRPGESICSFARSFKWREVDTWVIRAVYEELQPYCRFGRGDFPLRPTDRLVEDIGVDEDLDQVAEDIAYRTGRSLSGFANNPLYGKVQTASDLVMFFVHQPKNQDAPD